MPIVLHRNINIHTTCYLEDERTIGRIITVRSSYSTECEKVIKRQKEWVCSRLLLKQLTPNSNIIYNEYGAPTLSEGSAVSISHSHEYCAILVSKQTAAIDLELINTKAHQIKAQFITKEEELN